MTEHWDDPDRADRNSDVNPDQPAAGGQVPLDWSRPAAQDPGAESAAGPYPGAEAPHAGTGNAAGPYAAPTGQQHPYQPRSPWAPATHEGPSPWAVPPAAATSDIPLSWPAPTSHRHHVISRSKLVVAAVALVTVSAASSALIVDALRGGSGGTVATSAPITGNSGGSGNTGNAGTGSGSGSSSGTALSTSEIAAAVDKGVVDINTNLGYQNAAAAGTGMVLTSDGEILTNNHVIKGATSIKVTVVTTGKSYTASVVGTDPTDDVAVLQLQGASGLSTIPLGDSSTVQVGDAVVAIGNAGGTGGTPSVVTGAVTGVDQTITASDENGSDAEQLSGLIQVDAPIVAGDSGGPLANSSGKVIGMDTAASTTQARFTATTGNSEGYAIPIAKALSIAKQIESGQASSTIHIGLPGFLGVEVTDSSLQGGFGGSTSTVSGATVSGTTSGSPAAAAGITAGDVITSVNGTAVSSASALTSQLSGHHKGDKVTIGWTDSSGQSHTATITLTEGPAD